MSAVRAACPNLRCLDGRLYQAGHPETDIGPCPDCQRGVEWTPDYAVHPGEILLDELQEREWTQAHLARQTGFSTKHVNQIIKGKAHIGVEFAVALERVIGANAIVWLRLQVAHDLFVYRSTGTVSR